MSGETAKISFAFGGATTSKGPTAGSAGPTSNMARLLAQTQAKSAAFSSKTAPAPAPTIKGIKSNPKASIFDDDEEDGSSQRAGPDLSAPGPSRPRPRPRPDLAPPTAAKTSVSRAEKRAQEEALRVDSTVFDYDGVYDGMKAAQKKVEDAKKVEKSGRTSNYTENFLAAAQTRKLDRLRAEEKMLQLEREKEGGEFDDKEKFVTEAYKKQMEEVRQAEEDERKREGEQSLHRTLQPELLPKLTRRISEEIRKSKKGHGLSAFYQNMLDDESKSHAAAVAASHGSVDSGPNLSIRPPSGPAYEPEAEYDPFLEREAAQNGESSTPRTGPAGSSDLSQETGKEVEINDEGDVVDKRSLLKAGLNIMKKPTATLPDSLLTSQRSGQVLEGPYKSRAVGTAASYAERMDRERKRLADEMRIDAERKRLAEEESLRAEEEAARKRREGNDGDALKKRADARQRFLERKRAREVEEEEKKRKKAKEGGDTQM